jgi:Flp pilus assembly protein TadB
LRAWLRESGINGATGDHIALAVSEAFANAVIHPQERRKPEISVAGEVSEREVTVRIQDHGTWQSEIDPSRSHYGHSLMRTLMSRVRVEGGDRHDDHASQKPQAGTARLTPRRLFNMLLLILLALAAIILFGVGFTAHWLFIIAAVIAVVWLIAVFAGGVGGRSRGYWY